MRIRISELKLPVSHSRQELEREICRILSVRRVQPCSFETGFGDPAGDSVKEANRINESAATFPLRNEPKSKHTASTSTVISDTLRKPEVPEYEIVRRSIDARKKPNLYYVYTIDVSLAHPQAVAKKLRNRHVTAVEPKEYVFPYNDTIHFADNFPDKSRKDAFKDQSVNPCRPVIVGSGPAGLFCALMLSRAGLRPILLERGEAVEKRTESVRHFWATGNLNPASNVQFGEGGAGTFSDGKLNTMIKDPDGKIRFVLREFVKAGADPSILWSHKPHIGTDVLVRVVKHMREEIIRLGGEVRFETCLTGIRRAEASAEAPVGMHSVSNANESHSSTSSGNCSMDGSYYILELNNGASILHASRIVLAIGHSARDTFQMLYDANYSMEAKAFAVGLRVQHSQAMIDQAMYGTQRDPQGDHINNTKSLSEGFLNHSKNQSGRRPEEPSLDLGPAPYKLTHKCENGRGVYSFCMCPGGYVVNASSEPGMTAVNGMSYSDRGSRNANSAIVVTVTPEDYRSFSGNNIKISDRYGEHNDGHQSDNNQMITSAKVNETSELNQAVRMKTDRTDVSNQVARMKIDETDALHHDTNALDGIAFQRQLERAAFQCGDGRIPVQRFEDYCMDRASQTPERLMPEIKGQWAMANLRSVLPEELNASIIEGMHAFGRRIPGFDGPDVLFAGVESRTSSPVRILRGDDCQSVSHPGIFPCGEGAGYAGGITSAAVDGIRVAEAVCRSLAPEIAQTSAGRNLRKN
ncbi:MAG: FAD-binding protein [Lachnospiraceae bacterium]|nr:FAD-binding protein [Lachnospiraceae bacterium]